MVSVMAPFAAVADMYDEAEDDDFEPWTDSAMHPDLRLTLGQFRQLRALLAQPAAQHQGEPVGWTYEDGKEYTACPDHAHDLRAEGIELTPVYRHSRTKKKTSGLP
ncbi:hypothetical protein D3C77_547080 [compost metagenome]